MPLILDPARSTAPLPGEEPCGADLDQAGDIDFLNRVAHVESLLPASFFTRDEDGKPQPFDRASIDFDRESKALLGILERSRDLRILTLLARLAMLNRDLAGFAQALSAIATLLETLWDAVHPRGEDGAYELRGAVLQALEDGPTVLLPLQHLVLAQSRRHGPITFRSVMAADGEVSAPEGDSAPDRASIERALEEADPDAIRAQDETLGGIASAAARIAAVTVERGGYGSAATLDRLTLLTGRIRALLDRTPAAPAPAAGAAQAEPAPGPEALSAPAAGGIGNILDATAALAAAAAYLRSREPSSLAEVLVRQAQMLVGKSFLEVMRILVPSKADEAVFAIGASRGLRLTFDQLSAVPEEFGDGAWQSSPAEPEPDRASEPAPVFQAASRGEAVALLREVGAFFRSHEPSSPIPLLLDKAIGVADRDFLSLLRDVLPDLSTD